jgi:hypothetical protein
MCSLMKLQKSPRHSKITGDFAEGLVLYWLSKYGYECARIDHVGIDLIARNPDSGERMGISVKSRCRYDGTENWSINLPADGFAKASESCKTFDLIPYYAIVVDGAGSIRCFLLPMDHLVAIATGTPDGVRYWQMNDKFRKTYAIDPLIKSFELKTITNSWRDSQ